MNIDYLSNLVNSCDVSTFRTVASTFLRSLGYPGFLSDGPYDGAADFFVHQDQQTGNRTVFQFSTETKWKDKLQREFDSAKAKYPTMNAFVFVSSRRIPNGSMRKLNVDLIKKHGISATHYDNQAIATEFIDKNLVGKFYQTLNIELPPPTPAALTTPKVEAAASILIFGAESGDFRKSMMENVVLSELAKVEPMDEKTFIDALMEKHSFEALQRPDVVRTFRRVINDKKIVPDNGQYSVSDGVRSQLKGMQSLAEGEFVDLQKKVGAYLAISPVSEQKSIATQVLNDLLDLSVLLWRRAVPTSASLGRVAEESYNRVSSAIAKEVGSADAKVIMGELAKIVAGSDFAKRLAAAELFAALLKTNSSQLVAAIGASKGLRVFLDTQVLIPLICGLLFDQVQDHSAYSARLLKDLLAKHEFTAVAPSVYVNETAAHLIRCCQEYRSLLLAGEDLSFSTNAFASHFSQLRNAGSELSFDEYISVFGAPAGERFGDLSDEFFYPARDKIEQRMGQLLRRYQIEVVSIEQRRFPNTEKRISETLGTEQRPRILVEHDASVVGLLEGVEIEADLAKVLCTWDSMQFRLNPAWDSYCVMNPASLTDLLTIVRAEESNDYPMAQLVDFVWLQNEAGSRLAATVWDKIVEIEKNGLNDATLLAKARAFRKHYIDTHPVDREVDENEVVSTWLRWKREN